MISKIHLQENKGGHPDFPIDCIYPHPWASSDWEQLAFENWPCNNALHQNPSCTPDLRLFEPWPPFLPALWSFIKIYSSLKACIIFCFKYLSFPSNTYLSLLLDYKLPWEQVTLSYSVSPTVPKIRLQYFWMEKNVTA